MTNQRSPLDSLNMRRERRPLASLDELNRTLSALEDHLRVQKNGSHDAEQAHNTPQTQADTLDFLRHNHAPQPAPVFSKAPNTDSPHKEALAAIAEELQRLRARTELKQAAAISEKLQPSEDHGQQRLSSAERFIAGTSSYTGKTAHSANPDIILRRDFDELKRTVETLAREESLRRMSHRWDALDERFDNFTQLQSEKLHAQQSIDPALDAISARLEDIRLTIEQLPDNQNHSLRQLDERLDEISRAILATSYHNQKQEQSTAVVDELERRFADLTSHLDEQYRNSQHNSALHDDRFIQALENRLDHITRQVNEQTAVLQAAPVTPAADQQLMRNLEKQLAFITEHLSRPESLVPELAEIKPRLDEIERSIDISRDTVLSAAREAAEEAIRQVVDKGSARDTGFARQLADDLKALEKLTRETDERNSRTFDRVQDTLLKIADRLAQIEKDNVQKPPYAQTARPEPLSAQVSKERFINQFSIPEWGPERGHERGHDNAKRSTAPVAGLSTQVSDIAVEETAQDAPKKSFLSNFAKAMRSKKPEAQPESSPVADSSEDFRLDDSELQLETRSDSLLTQSSAFKTQDIAEQTVAAQTLAAMPDLNAIIRRVRDEQRGRNTGMVPQSNGKADLISAARQAMQAAAEETGRLRDQDKPSEISGEGHLNGNLTGAENRISDHDKPKRSLRKPLLLAIGAIIMAGTGLQLSNSYLAEYDSTPAGQERDITSAKPLPAKDSQPENTAATKSKTVLPTVTKLGTSEDINGQKQAPIIISGKVVNAEQPFSGDDAKPMGSQALPSQPLSATPMAASTQAVLKPVTVAQLPEAPLTAPQATVQKPDSLTTQPVTEPAITEPVAENTPEQSPAPETKTVVAQLSPVPAIPQEAGPIALRNAAESGDARALYEIGMRYTDGRGVASDFAEAAKWYELSAERGFAPAQYRLGNFSEKGLGVTRDAVKAVKLYEQAATQGNASAMHNLAVLYAMGADGKPDNTTAAKWFFKAAELGVKDSQYNLAILNAKGLGTPQNLEESYKWFALAANAGDKDAAEKRDQIAKSMKPEQLERAVNLTKLWKPKDMAEEANAVDIPDAWSDEKAVTTASVDMKKAVRNIQLILQKNGYDAGAADGLMGNKTRQAIAAFQKANGMEPTGEVDRPLVEALLAKNS